MGPLQHKNGVERGTRACDHANLDISHTVCPGRGGIYSDNAHAAPEIMIGARMDGQSGLPVAIVGAGPYGLSIAAHLRSRGVPFRIFVTPMHRWLAQTPMGMFLKSEWAASSLADPPGRYTLQQFCAVSDEHAPVPLDTFTRYACHFSDVWFPWLKM